MTVDSSTPLRSEHDSIGERSLPRDVYYGVQSLRAAENFHITGLTMHPEIINAIAEIKKASAITNYEIGLLDKKVADAIVKACDEIVAGKLHDAFIVDPIQGGAGTSLNMNANEVIANRAIELLGGEKGDYSLPVHQRCVPLGGQAGRPQAAHQGPASAGAALQGPGGQGRGV